MKIAPLWSSQDFDEEHIEIKILVQLFGFAITFWNLIIWFTALFSTAFLGSIDRSPSMFLSFLSSSVVNILLGVVVGAFTFTIIPKYHYLFEGVDIFDRLDYFKLGIQEASAFGSDMEGNFQETDYTDKYYLILVMMIGLGFIAGILYSVLYYIPYYLIFVFLLFIFANFTGLSSTLFVISMITAWFIVYAYFIRSRLYAEEDQFSEDTIQEYDVSERRLEILASNEEPVVCPGCRSFVAATKKTCSLCGESLDT